MRKLRNYDIQTLATTVIIVAGLGYLAFWTYMIVTLVPYPNQIDYGEGYNLYIAKLWATSQWSWDITQEPYLTLMYGPIYFLLAIPFVKWFGMSFEWGRIIMVVATIITCSAVGLIAYEVSKKKAIGLVAALLPLTQPIVRSWGVQSRVDPLATMFSVIGIWIAVKFVNSKWFWLSPLLFALSFYTKVNIIGILAVGGYLLINKQWRKSLYFTAMSCSLIVVPMAIYQPLFHHMILYNQAPIWSHIVPIMLPIATFAAPIAGLTLVAVYYCKKNRLSLVTTWTGAAIIVSTVLVLKEGSASNYYIEAIYAVSLACAVGIYPLAEYLKRSLGTRLAEYTILFIILVPIVSTISPHVYPTPNKEYTQAVEDVKAILNGTNELAPTEHAGILTSIGGGPIIEPMIFTNLANSGIWDEDKYVSDIQNKRFKYLVLRSSIEGHLRDPNGHFTSSASKAIYSNYRLIYKHEDKNAWWYIIRVYEAK